MRIYDLYGRLAEQEAMVREALEQQHAQHVQTIDVLRRVVSGELSASRVTVTGHSWSISAGGEGSRNGVTSGAVADSQAD